MSGTKEVILREVIVSFILGGIPVAVTFSKGGDIQLLNRLTTLNLSDEIFIYLIVLLVLHLIVYLINTIWLKPSDDIGNVVNFVHSVTEQVGFGIHGIYRALTGAVPTALLLLIYSHGFAGASQLTAFSVILVIGSLFMCWVLSLLNEHTKRYSSFF